MALRHQIHSETFMATTLTQTPPAIPQPAHQPTPGEQLMGLASGYIVSAALNVAARLRVADKLAAGPRTAEQLAKETNTHADSLYRILRVLAMTGVFTEGPTRTFALTPVSEMLRSGVQETLHPMVDWISEPLHYRMHCEMMHSARTGETVAEKTVGVPIFEYFERDREFAALFDAAMTNFSAAVIPAALEAYSFAGLGTLVDVAGGHGFVLGSILKKHSDLQGVLFDLPRVIAGAKPLLERL